MKFWPIRDWVIVLIIKDKSVNLTHKEAAGRPSILYDDKDKRYYRYKHSYHYEIDKNHSQINYSKSLSKPFVPSRLNYVDELKGIIWLFSILPYSFELTMTYFIYTVAS